jgi:hypothetical protein
MTPDLADRIFAFEDGKLDSQEEIKLFQALIDSGDAFKLQGVFGRTAENYIALHLCLPSYALLLARGTFRDGDTPSRPWRRRCLYLGNAYDCVRDREDKWHVYASDS